MSNGNGRHAEERHSDRRRFLTTLGVTAVVETVGEGLGPCLANADTLTKAQRDNLTPDQVITVMKQGNERFR